MACNCDDNDGCGCLLLVAIAMVVLGGWQGAALVGAGWLGFLVIVGVSVGIVNAIVKGISGD